MSSGENKFELLLLTAPHIPQIRERDDLDTLRVVDVGKQFLILSRPHRVGEIEVVEVENSTLAILGGESHRALGNVEAASDGSGEHEWVESVDSSRVNIA